MREGFVLVNSVPTQIFTWGSWIEDRLEEDKKEVVVFFPGNPGIVGFYVSFLEELHYHLGIPVWAVCFAGHAAPPPHSEFKLPPLEGNHHLYNSEGQIEHKIAFIEKYVPQNVKIILVAHSVGSKMALGVLKNKPIRSKVTKAYLLFPAIERMAESPSGKTMMSYMQYRTVVKTMLFLAWLLYLIPLPLRKFIISVQLMFRRIPVCHTSPTVQYMHPDVARNVAFLALDKIEKVRELDDKAFEELCDVLFLYYGSKDGWAPMSYWKEMSEKHPKVKFMVCKHNLDHAFCLNSGVEMAVILSDIIKQQTYRQDM
ncbi:lipid droplet-associated hydrolase-like [Periplaneta americana]|uniref:lipid droplet-associated hydrolase-like n=1 Tax=Periplaneta americana TaxID=6978 RepID=UPI0037E7A15A